MELEGTVEALEGTVEELEGTEVELEGTVEELKGTAEEPLWQNQGAKKGLVKTLEQMSNHVAPSQPKWSA